MPSKTAPIFVRLLHDNKRMYIILGNNITAYSYSLPLPQSAV
jgi:hypothetical protein